MNFRKLFSLLICLFLFSTVSFSKSNLKQKASSQSYFTNSDLNDWVYVIKDKTLDSTSVFKLNNGVLEVSGVSSGYIRTKKTYANYTLELDWRWTKSLGNSGVLVHIQPKDTIWPVCYQVQQRADAAGDIICMNGLWAKECKDTVKFTVNKMLASNEKALGEWNNMKVICDKQTIKVYINGVLQNSVTGLTKSTGFIGFQNEGKPLEYRNLSIK